MKNTEIERKWLMDGFPDLPYSSEEQTEQAYLCFEPVTVRIRRQLSGPGPKADRLTIKSHGGLQRTEVEVDVTADQYDALLPLAAGPAARKRLRRYALAGGLQLECSLVDEGEPTAFFYAEVEFADPQQAADFVPPGYLGREVTDEPGYSMADYCRRKAGR